MCLLCKWKQVCGKTDQLQYLIEKTTQCMCNIQNKNAHHAHIDMCTCTYIHMLRIHLTHTLNTCDTHAKHM